MLSDAYAFSDDEEQAEAERQAEETLSERPEREAVGNHQAADPAS